MDPEEKDNETEEQTKGFNMARYKKILAALDGGETRLAVARRALSLAHDNEADVLFVHNSFFYSVTPDFSRGVMTSN